MSEGETLPAPSPTIHQSRRGGVPSPPITGHGPVFSAAGISPARCPHKTARQARSPQPSSPAYKRKSRGAAMSAPASLPAPTLCLCQRLPLMRELSAKLTEGETLPAQTPCLSLRERCPEGAERASPAPPITHQLSSLPRALPGRSRSQRLAKNVLQARFLNAPFPLGEVPQRAGETPRIKYNFIPLNSKNHLYKNLIFCYTYP